MTHNSPAYLGDGDFMNDKLKRCEEVNVLLVVIASCGRRFFGHEGRVAFFEVDPRGRVWFTEEYSQRRIYTHKTGKWKWFHHGGTLRSLCGDLAAYIAKGTPVPNHFGPWPDWYCEGDLWGYGGDMANVRDAAQAVTAKAAEKAA